MSSTAHTAVLTAISDGIGRLTLNNPARKNAITSEMAVDIVAFCAEIDADPRVGALILDATGDYFCSGADTRTLAQASESPSSPSAVAITSAVYQAFVAFGSSAVPTVAVVTGGAVGAGMNFVFAADIVISTPDARLDSGFVNRQIHPGGGHLHLLGRAFNRQQAFALAVLGRPISGADAERLGGVYKTAPREALIDEACALVQTAAADPELARRIKHSATLELGANAVPWAAAVELERGVQMWSMARKGGTGWRPDQPSDQMPTDPVARWRQRN